MKRFSHLVLAAVVGLSALPVTAAAAQPATAFVDAGLAAHLADAAPTDPVRVMLTAEDAATARAAILEAGLVPDVAYDRIAMAAGIGTRAQIETLAETPGVAWLGWADQPAELHLDSSHDATRGAAAHDGAFDLDGDGVGDSLGGEGVGIAIVDSGVDGTHPMFAGPDGSKVKRNMKGMCSDLIPNLYDIFVEDGSDEGTVRAFKQFNDCHVDMTAVNDTDTPSVGGHGTHVAGIAGGYAVTDAAGRDLVGAAPDAPLYSVSTGAVISVYGGSLGLAWVLENHADPCGDGTCPAIKVVNNSWGSSGAFNPDSPNARLQRALVAEGVTVVWAAGNDGGDGSADNVNPYTKDPTLGVLSVANYDDAGQGSRDNALSSSSSRGEDGVVATYPDIAAPGTSITSACRVYLPICGTGLDTADPDYNTISGTSMAAPHVAGIVAQLQQAARATLGRDLSPAEVELALVDTAHQFGASRTYETDTRNPESTTGTSFDAGHGLVDVVAAVAYVTGLAADLDDTGTVCEPTALFTDPAGDANALLGVATPLPSEPSLDITSSWLTTDVETGAVTFHWTVDDLSDTPGGTQGNGEYFDYNFSFDGVGLYVQAIRTATEGEDYVLGWFDPDNNGLRTTLASLTGSFDPASDEITVVLPDDAIANSLGRKTIAAGDEISGLELVARREIVFLVPDADSATGGCAYVVAAEHDTTDPEPTNTAPAIDSISASDTTPYPGEEVAFAAAASDADGDALEITWDFGDGATAAGAEATHAYDTHGTYTVTVTVTDGTDTVSDTMTIDVVDCNTLRGPEQRDCRQAGNDNGNGNGNGKGKGGPAVQSANAPLAATTGLGLLGLAGLGGAAGINALRRRRKL